MSSRRALHALAPMIGIVVFLGLWQLVVEVFDVRPFVLRSPTDIVAYLADAPGDFLRASAITALHALAGIVFALVISIALGAVLSASVTLERAAQPILSLVQVTPFAAYIPAVVLWLGADDPPVRFIATLVCIPGFTFAAVAGMRSADPASLELFDSIDASRWAVLWRLRLPSAMPSLLTAARYNTGLALIVAYLVEGSNFADRGLGAIGRRAAAYSLGDALWATIFCMALLGSIGLLAIGAIERSVLAWHASQRSVTLP
ncbi:MAG: ABC transporter permease subunit [Ilumatobacteraceae bacterium]